MTTLILPCAGKSSRFPGLRPKWQLTCPDGRMMVEWAAGSIEGCDEIRPGIAQGCEDAEALGRAIGATNILAVLNTSGPAETTAEIIKGISQPINGPVIIKDCDSWFDPITMEGNQIAVASLRKHPELTNVAAKSFVGVNDQGIVTGIREKEVCSDLVCVGAYAFAEAGQYLGWYRDFSSKVGGEIFVSHVIRHAILNGEVFTVKEVENYVDVGTVEDWHRWRARFKSYFVDVDGVLLKNTGGHFPPTWESSAQVLPMNSAKLAALRENGAQVILTTARPESLRRHTEAQLLACGVFYDQLIMGLNHASRVLINDHAASNPYPAAEAISIARDSDELHTLI